jgi:hypothetical protein
MSAREGRVRSADVKGAWGELMGRGSTQDSSCWVPAIGVGGPLGTSWLHRCHARGSGPRAGIHSPLLTCRLTLTPYQQAHRESSCIADDSYEARDFF